ncbi:HD-GYP domain-containing protein [Paenibacillus agaridevorans]|uniref:HD-GYP domain-containing protein n=1 Tax=Paenibacillus agaridevorans TaxID=171404 RepID=UPI001BE47D18|nr:HD domain-containing phosphohydrolase [Paenibacillus agaridevorans]
MYKLSADAGMKQLKRKSPSSYRHCLRVSAIAQQFANVLGIGGAEKGILVSGCYLHDLGKLFIPNNILNRKGKLSDREWRIMRQHPSCGGSAAELYPGISSRIVEIVRYHHERWDGGGYPEGRSRHDIPYLARICAIIDTFDSMMSNRCYRSRLSLEDSVNELRRGSGTQFDPSLVEPFIVFIKTSQLDETMYGHPAAV